MTQGLTDVSSLTKGKTLQFLESGRSGHGPVEEAKNLLFDQSSSLRVLPRPVPGTPSPPFIVNDSAPRAPLVPLSLLLNSD